MSLLNTLGQIPVILTIEKVDRPGECVYTISIQRSDTSVSSAFESIFAVRNATRFDLSRKDAVVFELDQLHVAQSFNQTSYVGLMADCKILSKPEST